MSLEEHLKSYLLASAKKRGRAVEDIDRDDSFFDQGILDSMSLLDFVLHIEREYGVAIPGHEIVPENFGSLAAVVAFLREELEVGGRP